MRLGVGREFAIAITHGGNGWENQPSMQCHLMYLVLETCAQRRHTSVTRAVLTCFTINKRMRTSWQPMDTQARRPSLSHVPVSQPRSMLVSFPTYSHAQSFSLLPHLFLPT